MSIDKGFGILHYSDDKLRIYSQNNRFFASYNGNEYSIELEIGFFVWFLTKFRLLARLIRASSSSVEPIFLESGELESIIISYNYGIYLWDLKSVKKVQTLEYCRNVMQGAIAVSDEGVICFGEYASNKYRDRTVPLFISNDRGRTWSKVFEFEAGETKHIHCVQWDKFTKQFWVCTGDSDGECHLLSVDSKFRNVTRYGDGTQQWRACSLIFTEESVVWGMDSPLEKCFMVSMNRETRVLTKLTLVDGPVWYTRSTSDGLYIACTTVEPGVGCLNDLASIYMSKNLFTWNKLYEFKKDSYSPRLFKFGSISFSYGNSKLENIFVSFEAIKKYDGKFLSFKRIDHEYEEYRKSY